MDTFSDSSTLENILFPNKKKLIDKINNIKTKSKKQNPNTSRPAVIVVYSPYEKQDGATKFSFIKKILEKEQKFKVLNNSPINFKEIKKIETIRAIGNSKNLTVLYQGHGNVGWVLGSNKSPKSEILNILKFAKFIKKLNKSLKVTTNNIIINTCYGATELFNDDIKNPRYFASTARLVSMAIPNTNVIGYIGKNNDKAVTGVYNQSGAKIPSLSKKEGGAILFRNGKVIEFGGEEDLYIKTNNQVEDYLKKYCFLKEGKLYRVGNGKKLYEKFIEKHNIAVKDNFAEQQFIYLKNIMSINKNSQKSNKKSNQTTNRIDKKAYTSAPKNPTTRPTKSHQIKKPSFKML